MEQKFIDLFASFLSPVFLGLTLLLVPIMYLCATNRLYHGLMDICNSVLEDNVLNIFPVFNLVLIFY